MGKLKKIGIGFGIIGGVFLAIIIGGVVWVASMTPEERQQWEQERELERLEEQKQKELEKTKQEEGNFDPNPIMEQYRKEKTSVSSDISQFPSKSHLVTEEHIQYFIENYRGQDNSGNTLLEAVGVLLNVAYPNENILENPTTTVNFYALVDFERDLSGRYWTVNLEIDTYRETVDWVWLVDTSTSKIYGSNEASKGILDILDTFD